ncbi:MAG TPA: hypothetical protein VF469_23220, partial [Kofleriaceae bacterium]
IWTQATFVDDDTLLLWNSAGGTWQWYDVRIRAATPFAYDPVGLLQVAGVDPDDGRVLVSEYNGEGVLTLLRKGQTEVHRIAHGRAAWGRLMPHGAMLLGVGDGRLLAMTDSGPPREIAKLDGTVEAAVGLEGSGFAALSSQGELVRGDLATGALVRTRVPPGTTSTLAGDRAGRVLVAQDNHLLLWDRDLAEIARPDKRIVRIEPIDGGALLELADHAMVRSSLAAGAPLTTLLAPSSRSPLVSRDGKLVVGESTNGRVAAVETATGAAWDLPAYYQGRDLATISPTARRFVQLGYGELALWTLPLAPADLRRWLTERTNAVTDGDYALSWSWQP